MSDEIITTDYGFGVVQINKTNNNDKPEEIGVSNYLLADNNILNRKVKSLEHENKVLKRALCEIRKVFCCICEECVSESKWETSSRNAVENIRHYLSKTDLVFDNIKEKYGIDYFIQAEKEVNNVKH